MDCQAPKNQNPKSFSEMHEAVKLIENSLDATFTRLAQNISILQDQLEKTPKMYAYPNPYSNQYGDYGYATGVLCYWAVIIVIALTMILYGICIWKGMRGNFDLQRQLTGEQPVKLNFANPLNPKQNHLQSPQMSMSSRRSSTSEVMTIDDTIRNTKPAEMPQ